MSFKSKNSNESPTRSARTSLYINLKRCFCDVDLSGIDDTINHYEQQIMQFKERLEQSKLIEYIHKICANTLYLEQWVEFYKNPCSEEGIKSLLKLSDLAHSLDLHELTYLTIKTSLKNLFRRYQEIENALKSEEPVGDDDIELFSILSVIMKVSNQNPDLIVFLRILDLLRVTTIYNDQLQLTNYFCLLWNKHQTMLREFFDADSCAQIEYGITLLEGNIEHKSIKEYVADVYLKYNNQ